MQTETKKKFDIQIIWFYKGIGNMPFAGKA